MANQRNIPAMAPRATPAKVAVNVSYSMDGLLSVLNMRLTGLADKMNALGTHPILGATNG